MALRTVRLDDDTERILEHRARALDLYEAGHATLAEAAKLADLPVEGFIELLGKAGVPAVSYPPEDLADEIETAR